MSYLFKPGYGSEVSTINPTKKAHRQLAIEGVQQKILDTYRFYRDTNGIGYIDVGYVDFVQLEDAASAITSHIIYWIAMAKGIQLSASELTDIQGFVQEYALTSGIPFKGKTLWECMGKEA